MTSNCFLVDPENIRSNSVYLDGNEHHHLKRVARTKIHDKVRLLDGKGKSYLARVEEIEKDKTKLTIVEEKNEEEKKTRIYLAQALVKSKYMDFIIQKGTELGVIGFLPVFTSRSIIKVKGKIANKMERWQRIAREAAKQCERSWIPGITQPLPLKYLIKKRIAEKKLLLSESNGIYLREILLRSGKNGKKTSPQSVLLLVGPEGGWTEKERELILSHDFEAVSLGKTILRTETAVISSLALISHFWNS